MERRSLSSGLESQSNSSALTKSVLVCASDQEQLIQRDIYISIVSNSRLLYEALMVPLKAHRSHPIVNHYASDIGIVQAIIHSPSHLVLLDSGIGQNLTITCVQQWRLLRPFPYVVILELKNDTDLIRLCRKNDRVGRLNFLSSHLKWLPNPCLSGGTSCQKSSC